MDIRIVRRLVSLLKAKVKVKAATEVEVKVEVEQRAETQMRTVWSSLNLSLNLNLFRTLPILFIAVLMGWALSHETHAMAAADTAAAVDPGYRLGAEDVMHISVWKDEHLTREVVVRPDGMFSFPLVGDIQADDRTVEEIRADLVKRLTKYIPNPNVSVAVMKVLSYKVYVLGRVNKPGEYLIGHHMDVLQALSLAGGLTPFAAENDIKVIRRVKGQPQTIPFRYGDVRKGNDLEQNILLQRGDVVMVP